MPPPQCFCLEGGVGVEAIPFKTFQRHPSKLNTSYGATASGLDRSEAAMGLINLHSHT